MSEEFLDARGLICPLPVLKARKKLLSMKAGDILRVSVTDPHAPKDFALFCQEQGYALVANEENSDGFTVYIKI